jgi:hypothetical protein
MPNSSANNQTSKLKSALTMIVWVLIPIRAAQDAARRREAIWYQQIVEDEEKSFDEQLADLNSRQGVIYLYSTTETDSLLRKAKANPDVKTVLLHKTRGISDEGLASLATLPNLKKLVIDGSRITDKWLEAFRGNTSLEKLELNHTYVSNDGLKHLKDLLNLQTLILDYESRIGNHLTDAGLVHLKAIPKLTQLRIIGDWASQKAIAELQADLPNCKIYLTEEGPSDD